MEKSINNRKVRDKWVLALSALFRAKNYVMKCTLCDELIRAFFLVKVYDLEMVLINC